MAIRAVAARPLQMTNLIDALQRGGAPPPNWLTRRSGREGSGTPVV